MRPILVSFAGVIALGVLALSQASCSGDNESVQAANAPIGIATSQMFVTVENKAGTPLLDMTIALQTAGAPYTYLVTRMEAGQKRDVALSSFSSRDGTAFNLRLVRPKTVHVTAKDLTNKPYEAQVSWK